ncbi:MAG: hypothetical protein V1913_02340 [Fibrobacterota bacterium]
MNNKPYIIIIILLTALSMFLFLTHRRDCRQLRDSEFVCNTGQGMGKHGRGMGMGMGMDAEAQAARTGMFALIKDGSSDTTLIFSTLEGIVSIQRENQKTAIRKILALRDSLTGEERNIFLRQIDERFCQQGQRHGQGLGLGRGQNQ